MTTYTVTERGGCRIISGEVPISAFVMLTQKMSKSAVMDTDLARMLNAKFVIGEQADITRLQFDLNILDQARAQVAAEVEQLSPAAAEWWAIGKHGMSSEAMFYRFTGVGKQSKSAPSDPDDFKRCRLLLEQVPEFIPLLPNMAVVSTVWAALVAHWDDLVTLMDSEVPDWREGRGNAPKTYQLMKSIGC